MRAPEENASLQASRCVNRAYNKKKKLNVLTFC